MNPKTPSTVLTEAARPALVPKLRFPEFREAEGWECTRLGDLCEVVTKGSTPTSYGFDYVESGVRFVKIESLSDGLVDCSKTAYITEDCNASFFRSQLKENDILFSIAGALGVTAIVDRSILPANINQAIGIVRLKQGYSHQFLLHQLQADLIQSEIQRIKAGAAQPNISLSQLGDFVSLLPIAAEQQKIAECLSSVDELIAAQARKVDALKTHKKGLMQQLFPREGETQPRLRFPEFQNAGEWEEQRLDELAHYENGKAHENDISEKGRYTVVNSKFISTEGEVRKFSNEGFCVANAGNVLMVLSDVPNGRAIAKCYFVESDDLYTVNQRICKIQPINVNGRFLFYILDRNPYFLDFDDGIKQTNLRKEDVLGCPLSVPLLQDEQQRIADCLTSLDDLIDAQTQKHEALKTHKKGLMQQLFPSCGGVPEGRGGSLSCGGVPEGRGGSPSCGEVPEGRGGSLSCGGVPEGRGGSLSCGGVPEGRGGSLSAGGVREGRGGSLSAGGVREGRGG